MYVTYTHTHVCVCVTYVWLCLCVVYISIEKYGAHENVCVGGTYRYIDQVKLCTVPSTKT